MLLKKSSLNAGHLIEALARVMDEAEMTIFYFNPSFFAGDQGVGVPSNLRVGVHHFIFRRHHKKSRLT